MHFSKKIQTRNYSTSFLRSPPYTFPLESAKKIKNLAGLSGVYMIISNVDKSSFYIGSSVNLYRRVGEYYAITINTRGSNTSFESTLACSNPKEWSVMILAYVPKHLVLVEEQLAICNFLPPLNRSYKVKFNYWLPGFNVNEAIALATEYRNLFAEDSINFSRFTHLIQCFNNVQSVKTVEGVNLNDFNHLGKPVFVYDYITAEIVAVYGSINYALSALNVSQDTIYTSMNSGLVYTTPKGQQLVISSTALTPLEIYNYIVKEKPTQIEYAVTLSDKQGVIVSKYNSLQEFCRAHGVSIRTLRRKLPELAEFKGFNLTLTPKSRRTIVYCYDPDTRLRVGIYSSMTAAHATVNLRYATFRNIVKTNSVYNNTLFSFSDTYPTLDN